MHMAKTGQGTAMRAYRVKVRFAKIGHGGCPQRLNDDHVVIVRKQLRTEKSIVAIAAELGVSDVVLRNFIKRRNLCDLHERARVISTHKVVRYYSRVNSAVIDALPWRAKEK